MRFSGVTYLITFFFRRSKFLLHNNFPLHVVPTWVQLALCNYRAYVSFVTASFSICILNNLVDDSLEQSSLMRLGSVQWFWVFGDFMCNLVTLRQVRTWHFWLPENTTKGWSIYSWTLKVKERKVKYLLRSERKPDLYIWRFQPDHGTTRREIIYVDINQKAVKILHINSSDQVSGEQMEIPFKDNGSPTVTKIKVCTVTFVCFF